MRHSIGVTRSIARVGWLADASAVDKLSPGETERLDAHDSPNAEAPVATIQENQTSKVPCSDTA
jgi:hypothetical protein